MDTTKAQSEYAAANETLRHFATVLLAERTLFIAVTGALVTVLFSQEAIQPLVPRLTIELLGLFSGFVFLLVQESNVYGHFHCMKRAAALEEELNFKIWSTLPHSPNFRLRPATWAMRSLFLVVIAFWIIALILGDRLMPRQPSKDTPTKAAAAPSPLPATKDRR